VKKDKVLSLGQGDLQAVLTPHPVPALAMK
jgi:hypothetical protein